MLSINPHEPTARMENEVICTTKNTFELYAHQGDDWACVHSRERRRNLRGMHDKDTTGRLHTHYGGTAGIFSPLFLPGTPGYCTAFLIRVIILERCGLCALNLLFVYSPIRAGRLQPGPLVKTGGKR